MAENLGNAILKLTTDSSQFDKGIKRAKKGAVGLEKTFKSTTKASLALGASFAAIGFALKKAIDFGAAGAKIKAQKKALENLANSHGTSATKIIKSIKDISRNTIAESVIVENANKALLLGLNPEKFGKLIEIARAASKATGDTITKSFQDIVLGIGRQSRLILDNLGIIVNAEKANKDYAAALGLQAGKLTEAQRKQAFFNATLKAGQAIIDGVGNNSLDAADKIAQLKTALTEAVDALKIEFADAAEDSSGFFTAVGTVIVKTATDTVSAVTRILRNVNKLGNELFTSQLTDLMDQAKNLIAQLDSTTFTAARKLNPAFLNELNKRRRGTVLKEETDSSRIRMIEETKVLNDEFSDLNDEILLSGTALDKMGQDGKSAFALMKEGVFALGTSFSDSLIDMVTGSEISFKSILSNFFKMVSKMIAQIFIVKPLMDALFGAFGGGIPLPSVPKSLPFSFKAPGLAEGGRVKARPGGTLFNIGEGGEDEVVTPLSKLDNNNGGGAKIEQNINISPGLPETVRAEITSFLPQFAQISVDAVEAARRRGGSMAFAMGSKA